MSKTTALDECDGCGKLIDLKAESTYVTKQGEAYHEQCVPPREKPTGEAMRQEDV